MPIMADMEVPYVEQATITVDALAEEPSWRQAQRVSGFLTFWPASSEQPTGDTVVRVMADHKALYLFFEAIDPEPSRIRAALGRRDTRWNDDFIGFYLDTTGDAQRAYMFGVNPLGVQMDGTHMAGSDGDDSSWDGIWEAEAKITEQGWQAELAIPWRILRHPKSCDTLGLFVFRNLARLGEKSAWPEVDQDISGMLVQQALVKGPGELPASSGLDLVPELAFGWTESGPANHRLGYQGVFPGVTARWSPTPDSSILGAFNPDFSQVESDAAQVDVNRRYALYYDEKRPFFLEGREWFTHSFGELAYTRSMVLPLYGARATVEQEDWTVAALHVLDAQPSPSVSEGGGWTEDDLRGRHAAETLIRARRGVGQDSHVGLLLSDREVLGTQLGSRMVGFDTHMRITDRVVADASTLTSQTRFADSATSWAPAAKAEVTYGDETWHAGTWGWLIDPGFRAENGYLTDADQLGGGAWGGFILRPGWKALPSINVSPVNAYAMWTTSGELRDLDLHPHLWFQLGNGAGVFLAYDRGGTLWQDAWLETSRPAIWIGESWTDWLEAELYLATGRKPYYDAEDPRSIWINDVEPALVLHPAPWLALGLATAWEQALEDGEEVYEGWVGRARIDAYASRRIWGRFIADWSSFSDERSGEALVAWEQAPGRAIYLGGRMDLPEPDSGDPVAWQLQAKASWVFSL